MRRSELSARTQFAIQQMRLFQQKEETLRAAVTDRYNAEKENLRTAYEKTGRETFGHLDATITQRANDDTMRKNLVGDEQFYRALAEMYARIASVELELDKFRFEQENNSVFQTRTSRTGRTVLQ